MKLSFSLASKKPSANSTTASAATSAFESSTPSKTPSTEKQFVTEFDPSKKPTSQTLIIPPKPNEYKPAKKKSKNLDLPLTDSTNPLQFELDSGSNIEEGPDSISFGLNVRKSNGNNVGSGVDSLLASYKEDMMRLPDDPGFEEFEDMPVEGFGAALLAGYGWKEGRGIGRNAKEDVKIVEYKKWTGKEGLGFQKDAPETVISGKKDGKFGDDIRVENGGERKDGRNAEEVIRVESGNGRREEKRSIDVGMDNSKVDRRDRSRHSGIDVGMEDRGVDQRDRNRHSGSGERRDDRREHVLSSRRSDRDGRDDDVKDSRRKERRHRGHEDDEKKSKDERKRGHQEMRKSERVIWVRSHIRVRVVSEAVKGGRLYLKKGEVVDVAGPSCDILMDESRELVQGVSQECLETALPKRGGPVLVLYGKHKGVYGSLVEKDADKETGVVQDADNHEMFNVPLEQIAEFIGDPSYIGY